MVFHITDAAYHALHKLKAIYPDYGLLIHVDAGGCHGFQYRLEFKSISSLSIQAINFESANSIIHLDGSKVEKKLENFLYIFQETLPLIRGATLDYHSSLMKTSFVIRNNPQASESCSCERSFSMVS
jgi:iron-sulfur cluster assembly protein/iron-sulfur cluster insertion protein